MRDRYLDRRRQFEPNNLRLIIIGESPPASGLYFYETAGLVSEPLFAAVMKQLGVQPKTKADGLLEMQRRGWLLVDATYQPVDKGLSDRDRNDVIARDYPLLRADLDHVTRGNQAIPIVLIKANVCRILKPRLNLDGFLVLNDERSIPFPSHGNQNRFQEAFSDLLRTRLEG